MSITCFLSIRSRDASKWKRENVNTGPDRTTCEISSRRHSSWKNTTKMCHRIFHSPVSLGENRVRKFVKYTRHAEVSIIDRRSFYVWKEVENVKWNLFTGRFVSEKNKFVDTPVSLKVERNHKQENFIPHFQFIFARATTSGRLFGSSLSEISHVPVYLINFQTRFPAELSREEKFLRYIFPPVFPQGITPCQLLRYSIDFICNLWIIHQVRMGFLLDLFYFCFHQVYLREFRRSLLLPILSSILEVPHIALTIYRVWQEMWGFLWHLKSMEEIPVDMCSICLRLWDTTTFVNLYDN